MTINEKDSLEEIISQLCHFLQQNILAPDTTLTPETELINIGVDSFSLMELVLFIERRFELILPAESLTPEMIKNVNSLSHYCFSLLNTTNA